MKWRGEQGRGGKQPLGTYSYRTSSREVNEMCSDWPQKYFVANQQGALRGTMTDSVKTSRVARSVTWWQTPYKGTRYNSPYMGYRGRAAGQGMPVFGLSVLNRVWQYNTFKKIWFYPVEYHDVTKNIIFVLSTFDPQFRKNINKEAHMPNLRAIGLM